MLAERAAGSIRGMDERVARAAGGNPSPDLKITVENNAVFLRFINDIFETDSRGARDLGKLLLEIADRIDGPIKPPKEK